MTSVAQRILFESAFIKLNDTMAIPNLKSIAKSLNIKLNAKFKKLDIINTIIDNLKTIPDIDQCKLDEIITNGSADPEQNKAQTKDKQLDNPINGHREKSEQETTEEKVKNRGTGAGGANTNRTGLSYEANTDLSTEYTLTTPEPNKETCDTNHPYIKFKDSEKLFIKAGKRDLYKIMSDMNEVNTELAPAAGCKYPDEAYVNIVDKHIYIIEKKFQQTSGSVDEKIQTGQFKQYHYSKLFPNFKVSYIYCLSNWFKKPDYKSVLEYLGENKIQVYWGNDPNYKNLITKYLCAISNSE